MPPVMNPQMMRGLGGPGGPMPGPGGPPPMGPGPGGPGGPAPAPTVTPADLMTVLQEISAKLDQLMAGEEKEASAMGVTDTTDSED